MICFYPSRSFPAEIKLLASPLAETLKQPFCTINVWGWDTITCLLRQKLSLLHISLNIAPSCRICDQKSLWWCIKEHWSQLDSYTHLGRDQHSAFYSTCRSSTRCLGNLFTISLHLKRGTHIEQPTEANRKREIQTFVWFVTPKSDTLQQSVREGTKPCNQAEGTEHFNQAVNWYSFFTSVSSQLWLNFSTHLFFSANGIMHGNAFLWRFRVTCTTWCKPKPFCILNEKI